MSSKQEKLNDSEHRTATRQGIWPRQELCPLGHSRLARSCVPLCRWIQAVDADRTDVEADANTAFGCDDTLYRHLRVPGRRRADSSGASAHATRAYAACRVRIGDHYDQGDGVKRPGG